MKLKREAFGPCVAKVASLAGVDEDQAFGLLQEVADYGERMRANGEANPFAAAAAAMADEGRQRAIDARSDALRNALRRTEILNRIDAEGGIKTAGDTLRSIMHWSPKATRNDSIESQWHGLSRAWQASVGNVLRLATLEKAAISGELDTEIAEAMWRANGGVPDKSIEVSKPAQVIADAIRPALNLAKDRLNSAGARIADATDYVTHTSWNPRQLRLAAGKGATLDEAFEAWWARERPRMSLKTFEHLTPEPDEMPDVAEKRFGRSVYDATVSGVHMVSGTAGLPDDGVGYVPPAYEGTFNLGRRSSQERVVFWKDARSWADHMREFGGGDSIYAQAMRSLDVAGRRVSLMEKLGTNPEGNFNSIVRAVREKYRTDLDGLQKFDREVSGGLAGPGLKTTLDYLTGKANMPASAEWADRINQLLTWEATSKLGGVSVTHLTAAPMTVSSEMVHHGVSRLETIGNVLKAIVTGRGSAERQEALAEAGAYSQGYNLQIGSKLQQDRGVPGYISWGATQFMRLTGLDHFIGRLQADGVKSILMTKLGRNVAKAFDELDPAQANIMRRYGLGPEEWDLLRATPQELAIDGQRYLTPRAASLVNDASVIPLLQKRGLLAAGADAESTASAVQRFKWELSDKYLMYLNDAAERATVTPGVREQAIALRGAAPGSIGWALARGIAQFKMWPLAAWNQIINREIGYSLSRGEMAANFGWILALSAAGGALRMSVNDEINGRPQRNYLEPNTMLTALAQGGGLGVYGDMLFGETTRGTSTLAKLGGPLPADAETLLKMYGRFRDDISSNNPEQQGKAVQHMWPDLAHFAVGHLPFGNLIYLKGALEYLLWFHLFEATSPGWWERSNRRLEREQGRSMLGYQPGAGVPWGVPGINIHDTQQQ